NRHAPQNVLAGFWIPLIRKILTVSDARRFWTTKRRPVCLCRTFHCFRWSFCPGSPRDISCRNGLSFSRRRPDAAVDNHPTNLAFIRDDIEADVGALFPDFVFSSSAATGGRCRNRQLDLTASAFPVSR